MIDALDCFEAARLACLLEVTARKPGNVHRFADFADSSYFDFLTSACALTDALRDSAAGRATVGDTIRAAVQAIRARVTANTYLGTVLLLTPLVLAGPRSVAADLQAATGRLLQDLTVDDARGVYAAIRASGAGGLGRVEHADIASEPTITLLEAMQAAADRDLVARQYATAYSTVFEVGLPALIRRAAADDLLEMSIIGLHLELMAAFPDSLITRKCGPEIARAAAERAAAVLDAGWPRGAAARAACANLDAWLRADGNRRNPGTTADLVAATLYVALITRSLGARLRNPPFFPAFHIT